MLEVPLLNQTTNRSPMASNTRYWTGLDELDATESYREQAAQEFPAVQSTEEFLADERLNSTHTGRRDFLKFMGFSVTAATLAACEAPVIKSIPYTIKPEEITPGVANYYASTFYNGQDYGNILVKTREGRPIFVKSNTAAGTGKVGVRVNASVLGLYDSARLQGPRKAGEAIEWSALDGAVTAALAGTGRKVVLTHTVVSPSLRRAIAAFCAARGAEHIQYDAVSYQGIREAHRKVFGIDAVPTYTLSAARTVVTIGADLLNAWGDVPGMTAGWAAGRRPESGTMSRMHAFESVMTVTGSNADVRTMVRPSDAGKVAAALLAAVGGGVAAPALEEGIAAGVKQAAADLKASGAASVVVCGSNDPNVQELVAAINATLGAYGTTVDIARPWALGRGDDRAMAALVKDMAAGKVDVLIVHGANPAYSYGGGAAFADALPKVKASVSTALFADETASACTFIAPDHHYLESWGDAQRTADRIDLQQPTIAPLYATRAAGESFLRWTGDAATEWYTYVRATHNAGYTPAAMYTDSTWNVALHNGHFPAAPVAVPAAAPAANLGGAAAAVSAVAGVKGGAFELALYQKQTIGQGDQAANPMLQETPDPLTKITWDNYVTMARVDMEALGLNLYIGQEKPASVVKLTAGEVTVEAPAILLPGQKPGTVGLALGFGRGAKGEAIGKAAFSVGEDGAFLTREDGTPVPIGVNAFPFVQLADGIQQYHALEVAVEATGRTFPIACTQIQATDMDRTSIVKETTFDSYLAEKGAKKGQASWNKLITLAVHEDVNGDGKINAQDSKATSAFDLWHEHPVENVGHRWGMTIDLTTCTGCSACVTACHIENNVPVVGKDEVRRHRDMHWMRIDRFFASDFSLERGEEEGVGKIGSYRRMEDPSENPATVHMPMMCQHCNHAPCETVCPVVATTHSNEGLNQMTYNRCIGTRYCANNCPYKVRRFNWFNYPGYKKFSQFNPAADAITRMVLNPDVTVRSRGVMEKCSMCVQRIQAGKLEAKKNGTPVVDGAVVTACAEACPTQAISFGDLNDTGAQVRAISETNRAYHALEEIGVKPNIFYMTKVRNTESNPV
jgi:molybdopterin-containing oxidoreductase family iron-sulfur binding subunit